MTLVDEHTRMRAMTDLAAILMVEAAAGTGKTSLLAGRVAIMLGSGIQPSEIAAITFTELAASELARKVQATVDDLLKKGVPKSLHAALPNVSKEQRKNLEKAALRLDELTATTIHGFCQSIIRDHAIEAGLDPGARIVDAPVSDAMFADVFADWLSRRLTRAAAEDDPIAVLSRNDPLGVVDVVQELAVLRRKHPTAHPLRSQPGRSDLDFVEAVRAFARWHAATPGDDFTAQLIEQLEELAAFFNDVFAGPRSFAELLIYSRPRRIAAMQKRSLDLLPYRRATAWRRIGRDRSGALLAREAESLFDEVRRTYQILLGRIAEALIASISAALDDVLTDFAARKHAAAVLDFDDLLLFARNLILNHEGVRVAIGERYRYLLVDEFQDTDQLQTEIIFLIAAETRPSRWQEARLRPGALFIVGDPKQAIYRFRGADIEAYGIAKDVVLAQPSGALLSVSANFRSQKAIVEHVNAIFLPVFSKAKQPEYVALQPTLPAASHCLPPACKVTVDVQRDASAEDQREEEARVVAYICSRLIGSISIDRPPDFRSPLRAGDIALLAPTHTDLWRYERALEERRISVASQAGLSLLRRQETQDILALARTLSDPLDTLAFGALMRGPLVGLTDEALLDITASLPACKDRRTPRFSMLTDTADVANPLARSTLETLKSLRRLIGSMTPSQFLAHAVEALQIRVVLAARTGNRNTRAVANIDMIIERAKRYSVAGLRKFVRDLQRDWEDKKREAEGRVDSSEDSVELVTMHSAKGLEWPVVIPINSSTRFRPEDQFVHRQSDNTLHWIIGGIAPPELAAARVEEETREARQRERLWYVACTRARDLLIIPHLPEAAELSWSRVMDLGQRQLVELDLNALPAASRPPDRQPVNTQTEEVFAVESAKIADSAPSFSWRRPSEHDPEKLEGAAEVFVLADAAADTSEAVGAGRIRGLVLHKLMEEYLTGELAEDTAASHSRAQTLIAQLGADSASLKTVLPEAEEIAGTALSTIRLPAIAAMKAQLVAEVPVWSAGNTYLLAGRADAIAIANMTPSVVIDWKSDIAMDQARHNRYTAQLRDYMAATGASRGAIVYMTYGSIAWVEP